MLDVIIAIMMKIKQMILYICIYKIFTKGEKEGQEMEAKGKKCS